MGGQGSNAENVNVAKVSLHEKWMIKQVLFAWNVSFGLSFCKTHTSEISGQISNILPQSVFSHYFNRQLKIYKRLNSNIRNLTRHFRARVLAKLQLTLSILRCAIALCTFKNQWHLDDEAYMKTTVDVCFFSHSTTLEGQLHLVFALFHLCRLPWTSLLLSVMLFQSNIASLWNRCKLLKALI